jgi:V/A-type H+/Na+-transporting ATPase subunit B
VLVDQGRAENRNLDDTLDRGWQALRLLPRRELAMLSAAELDARYPPPAKENP